MTRKKSRPTHRENAAAVPSNERGFYKMFWNSMDTNPGTNGPNSPSQRDAPVTSPPVIIISDSEGSPCAHDENSCENLLVPQPIKEEICEDTMVSSNQHSWAETSSKSSIESHSAINIDFSSHQTCLPGNPLTSPSKNSSSSPSVHTHLHSPKKPPETFEHSTSTCVDSAVSGTSSHEPPSEIFVTSDQPQDTPPRAEENGDTMKLVEDTQVCDQVTTEEHVEMFPESNLSKIANSDDVSKAISFDNNVISNEPRSVVENADDTPVANDEIFHASPVLERISTEGVDYSYEIPEEPSVPISELQSMEGVSETSNISEELPSNTETPQEMSEESAMEPESAPQTPPVTQLNYGETPHELPGLSLLRSLLNAPDEDLEDLNLEEALAELPGLGLIAQRNDPSDQNSHNEGEMVCFESVHESSLPSNVDVSDIDIDQDTTLPENILSTNEKMTPEVSNQKQTNENIDKNDEFPTLNNFLPKKIKLDTTGILRSVKVLKDSVRSLYKEYLNGDVILRTVGTSEPPAEDDESSGEVEESPGFPPISVYPICCVKMERLPDPFVKKSTVVMSDDTFKTWRRQITRQQNEERFQHLKVWRRGRTRLWRECELTGMDRATYDEQVAYIKKHKLNEINSSDSESSDDDSEGAASSHKCDSSEESYSDLENEDSEGELSSLPSLSSPTKQNNSETQSVDSSHITSTDIRLSEDEYVVERANQSSGTKAPSALKITIRKASTSKSEDDKEKATDEEENFPVPAHPTVKSRKIATKRTYRRPSDPIPKASVPPKPTAADTKKAKSTPVEDEYDQSLLGTRSYEVENFNLLEKWDIPFEEPTLFRSPRAASRLAQLKTKEAFQPVKRHAPPKTATTTATTSSSTTITTPSPTTSDVTTNTVTKAVKDVVEMLCSKTVEAMLFPESKSPGSKKPTKTDVNSVDSKDSTIHIQPSKSLVPNEEASSNFDESSEFSQSETNSTLDASSDFGGSTASLVLEDFPPPKMKSPQKPRRRRPRFGPAWGKKKKVKSKVTNKQPVEKESCEKDEHTVKDINDSPVHSAEKPVAKNVIQEKGKSTQEVGASPVHSTQVPVVSEGPGQSPYESEDDSSHRLKEPRSQNDYRKEKEETQSKDVIRSGETPSEEPKPNKKVQEEVVPPRLTRSKQPTVELDPDLLENFGTRKRKPKTGIVDDVLQGEDGKKSKLEITMKTAQKSKAQTIKPSLIVSKETSSTPDEVVNDDSNTQVPEVSSSEGPGDVGLDHETNQDQLNKVETGEPTVRMLRSRSRGPGHCPTKSAISPVKHSTDDNQKTDEPLQVEENKSADENHLEEPLVLESPASPPPETVEPKSLINNRITRSKRRSGPAYVAVKSTVANALPSVCDVVDSIAGHMLPTPSKLFDTSTPVTSSLATEPITAFRVQALNVDHTPIIDGGVMSSSSNELVQQPRVFQNLSSDDKLIQPPKTTESMCQGSIFEQSINPMDSDTSTVVPEPKSITETSFNIAGQTSELSNDLIGVDIPCLQTEKSQSAAAVEGGPVAVENLNSGTASASSSLALEKPVTENVECGRLEVLDTLNSILAVTSPKKVRYPVSTTSPLLPPPLSSNNLQTTPPINTSVSQPPVTNILTPPTVNSTSLPGFLNSTQGTPATILPTTFNVLPGTFLSSFLNTTLDANLTTYSNEMNDSTSLADDPDGDLVIDEGEVNFDVNFWDNLTNADLDKNDNSGDFSDDDNNTDLADKIAKIVKDQIHQDPVPVPSLKPKETGAGSGGGNEKVPEETSPSKSVLNRRDSIDDRTGLPTNFIQRLRDPRIRSRLLSQWDEEEATGKTPTPLAPLLNSLSANNVTSSTVGVHQAGKIGNINARRKADGVVVVSSSSTTDGSCMSLQVPTVSQVITQPVMGAQFEAINSALPGQPNTLMPLVLPNTPALATTLLTSGTLGQLPLVEQGTPILHVEDSGKPEEPPDPSKVDFVVPPSDDEEEESVKRRPKKVKKQVDVELMYKSPLEDLQSEARSGYGERAPRRYADSFPRRRSGDDRSRWDDRRSRDERRFEERGRSRSRDQRFDDRARSRSRDGRFDDRRRDRSRSRDQRAFYDRSPRDQSRDRRAYDPYTGREDPDTTPHHMEMQVPYNQSPWPVSPAFHHHQMVMQSPRWQPNHYPETHIPHPPIFAPEPPKIDFMETRLINLELLPKTTNLEISPIRKVLSYFDKDCYQPMPIPPPTYDPKDQPHVIKMMDPASEEMVDFIQTPRPTGGLTKDIFKSFPPPLNLDDVVKFHFISPSYIMVQDNEEDPLSSSDEEEDKLEAKQNVLSPNHQLDKPLQCKKRVSKPVLDQKRQHKPADDHLQKQGSEPLLKAHPKGENELITGNHLNQESAPKNVREDTPLQSLLQNLPLLQQFSLQQFQPPIPPPPPPPEWNDVDLRISRELAMEDKSSLPERNSSPPKERSRKRSSSRSKSPRSTSHRSPSRSPRSSSHRSRSKSPRSTSHRSRSRSPRSTSHRSRRSPNPRRRRSRSSDMSVSPSRSRSRSPSYSRGGSRRRRSRSTSSERSRSSRSRRSRSPKRHSTSNNPSRKHRR